jgi:hypothetical protein
MSASTSGGSWKFIKFGLIVTGKGEREFLPKLFRDLTRTGHCSFSVIKMVRQLDPVTSPKRRAARVVGSGKLAFNRYEEDIGVAARQFIGKGEYHFVILLDDLEGHNRDRIEAKFRRYREPLDGLLKLQGFRDRAAVHFFRNMLEAYFLSDTAAVNAVLGTSLTDHEGDVEEIANPKRTIKEAAKRYREIEDGKAIVSRLDLQHVLGNPRTCASLRSLIAWCSEKMGVPFDERYRLSSGAYLIVTGRQLKAKL